MKVYIPKNCMKKSSKKKIADLLLLSAKRMYAEKTTRRSLELLLSENDLKYVRKYEEET